MHVLASAKRAEQRGHSDYPTQRGYTLAVIVNYPGDRDQVDDAPDELTDAGDQEQHSGLCGWAVPAVGVRAWGGG